MSQDDILNIIESLYSPKVKPVDDDLWDNIENYMMDPQNYQEQQPIQAEQQSVIVVNQNDFEKAHHEEDSSLVRFILNELVPKEDNEVQPDPNVSVHEDVFEQLKQHSLNQQRNLSDLIDDMIEELKIQEADNILQFNQAPKKRKTKQKRDRPFEEKKTKSTQDVYIPDIRFVKPQQDMNNIKQGTEFPQQDQPTINSQSVEKPFSIDDRNMQPDEIKEKFENPQDYQSPIINNHQVIEEENCKESISVQAIDENQQKNNKSEQYIEQPQVKIDSSECVIDKQRQDAVDLIFEDIDKEQSESNSLIFSGSLEPSFLEAIFPQRIYEDPNLINVEKNSEQIISVHEEEQCKMERESIPVEQDENKIRQKFIHKVYLTNTRLSTFRQRIIRKRQILVRSRIDMKRKQNTLSK